MRPVPAASLAASAARVLPRLAWFARAFPWPRHFHCIQQANFAHFLSNEFPVQGDAARGRRTNLLEIQMT
jgi:hypothetical protein